jgi:hypothetical protein
MAKMSNGGAVEEAAPAIKTNKLVKFFSIYPEYKLYLKPEIKTKLQNSLMQIDTVTVQKEVKVQFAAHMAWVPEEHVEEAKSKPFYGMDFIDGRELKANLKSKDKRNQSLGFCRNLTRNGKRAGIGDHVLEYEDLLEELADGHVEKMA